MKPILNTDAGALAALTVHVNYWVAERIAAIAAFTGEPVTYVVVGGRTYQNASMKARPDPVASETRLP